MDRTSEIKRLKDQRWRDEKYEAMASRIALEQALNDDIDAAVWEDIQVEYDEIGRVATLVVGGHKPIRAMCHVGENGVGLSLSYWVMSDPRPHLCQKFIDALILAEKLNELCT